jgi:hypothetical protein
MSPVRAFRGRWIAASFASLLATLVLVPSLHDALSHHSTATGDATSVSACLSHDDAPGPEICPICFAGKHARALPVASRAQVELEPAPAVLPPAPPVVAQSVVPGSASPRAPPTA